MDNPAEHTQGWELLGAVPTIIYVFDVESRQNLFQNRSLGQYLGYDVPETAPVFDEWRRYTHPDDLAAYPSHFARLLALKLGEVIQWEYRLKRQDGAWLTFVNRDNLLASAWPRRIVVGVASDITEQRAAERQKDLLVGEVRHRSRNFGTVLDAIARQTRPTDPAKGLESFDRLVSRLRALNDATEAVLGSATRSARLDAVIRAAVAPLVGPALSQVTIAGSDCDLGEQRAAGVALVIHELATNALKYGALSSPGGRVELFWTVSATAGPEITLCWSEHDGPRVCPPERKGFGTRVLKSAIPGSRVALCFEPDGVRCALVFTAR
ncbi:MAG: PAS domain-containing protein [Alphaproteobacteria bacterium]|nr:PAS domain-containing protein [Alphaproteobacteria bacterium]